MRAAADRVATSLAAAGVDANVSAQSLGVVCRVPPSRLVAALDALRAADFEMLVDLFAADTGKRLEVTYHLRCMEDLREVYVRTRAGYDAVLPSASGVFPSAAVAEREAAELFGLTFAGNPDMRRMLTTSALATPPMRKAFVIGATDGAT